MHYIELWILGVIKYFSNYELVIMYGRKSAIKILKRKYDYTELTH